MTQTPSGEGLHTSRILRLAAIGIVIELAIFGLAKLMPAAAMLLRTTSIVVATIFVIAMWRARRRSGHERRETARRRDQQP